jgi:hypothetical protein
MRSQTTPPLMCSCCRARSDWGRPAEDAPTVWKCRRHTQLVDFSIDSGQTSEVIMLPDSRARFEPATLLQFLEAPQSSRDRCGDQRDRCELVGAGLTVQLPFAALLVRSRPGLVSTPGSLRFAALVRQLVGYDFVHHLDLGELGEGSSRPPGAIPGLAFGGGLGLPSRPLTASPGGQQSSKWPKLAKSPLAEAVHSHAVVCSCRVIPEGRSRGCVRGSGTCTTHPSRVEYAV